MKKTILGSLALMSSLSAFANECVDLSGKYFVNTAEKDCVVDLIVGGRFDQYTVGYSPFLMGFAVDLKVNNGFAARAGNNRAFEWKQNNCNEVQIDAWAYQQLSYQGIKADLTDKEEWGYNVWDQTGLNYHFDFSSKYHYGRYRHKLDVKYSKDESGNLVLDYHYVDQRGPKKGRRFTWTTVAEYKTKCVFKKDL